MCQRIGSNHPSNNQGITQVTQVIDKLKHYCKNGLFKLDASSVVKLINMLTREIKNFFSMAGSLALAYARSIEYYQVVLKYLAGLGHVYFSIYRVHYCIGYLLVNDSGYARV